MQTPWQSIWFGRHRAVTRTLAVVAVSACLVGFSGIAERISSIGTPSVERASLRSTSSFDIDRSRPVLSDLGELPSLEGGSGWINSAPITRESLRGKVAMIEIWTFACINCLHALPHVKETAERYREKGLVTIGVHTPELPQERVRSNVEAAVKKLGVTFPVVLDNNFTIWKAFKNQYWPSVYLVDRKGRIRFHHDGEGQYAELDEAVALLLAEKP